MGLADGPGIFLGDEVLQSSNPAAHADGIVANMWTHRVPWVAQQINDPAGGEAIRLLKEASVRRGYGSVGSWSQGLPAQTELDRAALFGSQFHIANVESPGEDQAWRDQDLSRAKLLFPNGMFGVIFTEAAWGRDPAKTQRWRNAGAVAIPEAIQSENPQATILAMLDLANALGFPAASTAPCVYLTRGYAASNYNAEIVHTGGRWSVFRYGDIDQVDWDQIHLWPRPFPVPEPEPEPEPEPVPEPDKYAELDRLVGLFRAGSPNIAKAFDEVEKILRAHDAELAALRESDDLHAGLIGSLAGIVNKVRAALA